LTLPEPGTSERVCRFAGCANIFTVEPGPGRPHQFCPDHRDPNERRRLKERGQSDG
jgi:hypothetical protein